MFAWACLPDQSDSATFFYSDQKSLLNLLLIRYYGVMINNEIWINHQCYLLKLCDCKQPMKKRYCHGFCGSCLSVLRKYQCC